MIIAIPNENSIIKWKNNDKDEWKYAEISDLIKAYEKPQGKWILSSIQVVGENWYKCSICGRKIRTNTHHLKEYPFCHCGAAMRGKEE